LPHPIAILLSTRKRKTLKLWMKLRITKFEKIEIE
jgi:hypothetical protein